MAEVKLTITGEDKSGSSALQSVQATAKSAFDSIGNSGLQASNMIKSAWDTLGVKSAADMDLARNRINSSFDAIKNSHASTQSEITRAEAARAKALEDIDKENFASRSSLLDKFKENWIGIAAGLTAIWAATSYLRGAGQDALDAETAFNKLKMQVENLGLAYNSISPTIDAAVHKTAEYARVQDENVAGSLQKLIFLTGNLDGSMKNLNLVYDLAYQKGISTEEAATLIGKAMSGNVDMLGRYIPELHNLSKTLGENATEVQKTAYAMALLQEKTQGASDRMTEHEKEVQRVTKAYKDAHQELGGWLLGLGDFVVSTGKALGETAGFVSLMFTDGPNAALKMEIAMHQQDAATKAATDAAAQNTAAADKNAVAHQKSAAQLAAEIKATNDYALALEKLSPPTAAQESSVLSDQTAFALKQLDEQHAQGLTSEQAYYAKRETIIEDAYSKQFDIESKEYDRIAAAQAKVNPAKEYGKWLDLGAALIQQDTKLLSLNSGFDLDHLTSAYDKLKALEAEQSRLLKYAQAIANVGLDTKGLQIDTIDNSWDKQTAQMEVAYAKQRVATDEQISALYDAWAKDGKDRSELIAAYEKENLALEQKYAHDRIALEKTIAIEKAQIVSTSIGQVGQLLMTGNEKQFSAGKALAEAEAAINAALAIVKAYGQLGPIYGTVAAVGIGAAAAVQIEKIESQQYSARAAGGPVDAGGTYLVGEQGPELLTMGSSSGYVTSNKDLASVTDLAAYKAEKIQNEQLDATTTLIDAVTQNTVAVTKVADGLTTISGVLTAVATLFTGLTSSEASLSYNTRNAILENANGIFDIASQKFSSIYDLADKLLVDTIGTTVSRTITDIFGGTQSISGQGIQLGYSNGSLQASSYATTETSGGLFSSNSYDTQTAALDASLTKLLDDTVASIKDSVTNAANVLGQATTGLDSVVVGMTQLDLSGLSNDDASKAVEDWMQSLGNAFADSITGLDALVQPGENSYDALIRLAGALQAVNDATTLFGGTVMSTSLDSAAAASSLVDLMGGLDAFNTATSNYESKMFTSGDQANMNAAAGYTEMSNALAAVGYAVPATSDQFKAMVNSLDLTTTAGQDAYAAFMLVTDGAAAFYDQAKAISDAATAMSTDLTVRNYTAAGDTTDATLYQLRMDQLAETQKDAASGLYTTAQMTELATTQTNEWAKAVSDASNTISTATQSLIDSSKTALTTMLSDQQTILGKMKSILTTDSSLSPGAAYTAAQQNWASAKASGNAADLTSAADTLESASKAYNASGAAFQADLKDILDTLGNAVDLGAGASLDAVDNQITLLTSISDSLDNGDLATNDTLIGQLGKDGALYSAIEDWIANTDKGTKEGTSAAASETMGQAYDTYASAITAAKSAYNAGGSLTDYQNTTSSALSTVDSAYDTALAAGATSYVDSSGRTHYMTYTPGGIVGGGHAGGTSELAGLAVTPTRTRTTDWAQSGIDWINSSEAISGAGSLFVSAQPIKWAVYDINKDNKLDQTDISLLQAMIADPSTLPTYAVGSPFLSSDQFAQVHEGEAIIDAQSNAVLQKYGIKVQASGGNNDAVVAKLVEQIAELKEQNKHQAATVKVLSAAFQEVIKLLSEQNKNSAALASNTRLAQLNKAAA